MCQYNSCYDKHKLPIVQKQLVVKLIIVQNVQILSASNNTAINPFKPLWDADVK